MAKAEAAVSFMKSGMAKVKFCDQLGISMASLYHISDRSSDEFDGWIPLGWFTLILSA